MSELSSGLAKLFHSAIIPYNPQDLLDRGRQAGLLESVVGADSGGRSSSGCNGWGYNGPCGVVVHLRTGVQGKVSEWGWLKRESRRVRARIRETSKGTGRGQGERRVGAPVTARYGSLSDQCRYRVAVSSESLAQFSLRHFSFACLFREMIFSSR